MKKTAAILAIGDELVNGEYQNTNTTEISAHLTSLGYKVKEHAVCVDQRHLIARALSRFLGEYDLVVVSGGLGPTSDDVTRFAVADAMHAQLTFYEECWDHIVKRMQSFNLTVREEDKIQAHIPAGSTVLKNTRGLASGFLLEQKGTTVAVLPGPPSEMRAMLSNTFKPEDAISENSRKFEWKLMGLTETETNVFVSTLAAPFAEKVKYLWRYPYLNIAVEVENNDEAGMECVEKLDRFLHKNTISRNRRTATELLDTAPDVRWVSDDAVLAELLKSLPGKRDIDAPQYVVNTMPALSAIGADGSYTGSLHISCTDPNGQQYSIATPLRGPEVSEYVKEFSAWSYLRSQLTST